MTTTITSTVRITSTSTIITSTETITLVSVPTSTAPVATYTHGLTGTSQVGNYTFINALIVFFCLIAAALIFLRLWKLGENYIRHVTCTGAGRDHQGYWIANRTNAWPWIKRYVLYAPLWNKRHNKEWQISKAWNVGTLPSRLHFLILVFYFLGNLVACLVLDYTQSRAAILAELRGRTGALAAFNLIPTVLFALRNNPFIGLLRVSYDTFNLLHRGLARIVVIESVAHVACWAIDSIAADGSNAISSKISQSTGLQWATTAVVLLTAMIIAAWSPIRHAFYETFLNTHRLFAFISIIAIYEHLLLGGLPQTPYIVIVAVFWAADWTWRLSSIAYWNLSRTQQTLVLAEALPHDAVRLSFELVRRWRHVPGSHIHVYLPAVGLWSSHPFSAAWAQDLNVPPPTTPDEEKATDPTATLHHALAASARSRTKLSCIVRAETGMTRALFDRAAAAPNRVLSLRGAIEGPYGGHESLQSYGTVLLFAGGVGITHQLAFVRQLVEGHRDGTAAARRVVLVWSVTHVGCLEWVRPFMDEILRVEGRREVLRVDLHVTRGTVDVASGSGMVRMRRGRCDVQRAVDEAFVERVGAMAVTVCGPGSFSDDVREAVRGRVGCGSVDFIEEAFTY